MPRKAAHETQLKYAAAAVAQLVQCPKLRYHKEVQRSQQTLVEFPVAEYELGMNLSHTN